MQRRLYEELVSEADILCSDIFVYLLMPFDLFTSWRQLRGNIIMNLNEIYSTYLPPGFGPCCLSYPVSLTCVLIPLCTWTADAVVR